MPLVLSPCKAPSQRDQYLAIRAFSEKLAAPLSPEDCVIQSMADASPVKWHLAHTTWFFETFVLRKYVPAYRVFHERYCYLFNSYYNAVGQRHPRQHRGMLSRPSLQDVLDYREYVDAAMSELLDQNPPPDAGPVIEIGLHHEQQHQELILTDVKHLLFSNPLLPAYQAGSQDRESAPAARSLAWHADEGGLTTLGYSGDGFHYDNEGPAHTTYLQPFQLATRLITNGEYLNFVEDGGYQRAELWLSDGWEAVQRENWSAPMYWLPSDLGWEEFTLTGLHPLESATPVTHVSYYEADAFARWSGGRLATEAEWEHVARKIIEPQGNFVESGRLHPQPETVQDDAPARQMLGDVWEWTASPYVAYPGFVAPDGALGEYNGKFMCNQMVLRGGSCATSQSHIRTSYRNFFYPHQRWQFTGIRLAR